MSSPLNGKVAVICGASTGVGRATAIRLAESGAQVVLLARRKDRLDEVVETIGAAATTLPTDITSPDEVRAAFDAVGERHGHLDILVNCAGVARVREVAEMSDEDIHVAFGTNTLGPVYTTRAAVPLMRTAGGGDIVNISSEITLDHMPLMSLYSASKAGLNQFTEAMAVELRGDQIRVSLVILGGVSDTGFGDNFSAEDLGRAWPIWEADGYLARQSGHQFIAPERVADALHHLVTLPPEMRMDRVHIRPS